ncbi:MAG: FAD-binding protein [Lachnospiraceae bacterium]
MRKKFNVVLGTALVVSMAAAGCSKTDTPQAETTTEEVQETEETGIYTPGTYSASAKGYGGDVTVTITVDTNAITDVVIEGADETEGVGSKAIEELPKAIMEAQNAEVDSISGATVTSKAIQTATAEALAQAKGEEKETASVNMKPGTYTASAWGFAKAEQLEVSVTVNEKQIESIEVTPDNGETQTVLQSAIDLLIPKMIENQSVTVDAICGATTSSNAIKTATEAALVQALTAAGSSEDAVKAFYVDEPVSTAKEERNVDVLVIGMGGSGFSAAMSAAQEQYAASGNDASKVSVLGIDKAGKYGGTSALTSSPMAVNPPSMVEEKGSDYVDVATFKADWMDYTEGEAKEELIDVMLNESGETLDWLVDLGFEFAEPVPGFGTPYEVVCYYGEGFLGADGLSTSKSVVGSYFDSMMEAYESIGGQYMLQTEGTELILENGKVTGAKAVGADGTEYTIHAKAVILAGGGFAGNPEMQKEYLNNDYYPLNGTWNLYGCAQNDGATIQMALDAGAGTYNISVPPMVHIGGSPMIMHDYPVNKLEGQTDMWTHRTATWSLNDIPMVMALSPDTMAVNMEGKRFTDEAGLAMMDPWKAGPEFYSIWSYARIKDVQENGFEYASTGLFINQGGVPVNTPIAEIYDVLETAEGYGMVVKADTIEELAEKLGMDPSVLAESVANYNAYCETGEANGEIEKAARIYSPEGADLGEAHYLKGIGEEGPYYAVKGASWCYSTAGGLDVDAQMRVLQTDGETPIEGLYAVGTDTIGVLLTEKKEYVKYGGAAQGWAFTSGKVAGKYAAEYVAE